MRRFVISVVVLMSLVAGVVHAQFEPVPPTNANYIVMIDEAILDGETLDVGDQIGIFDGELCVGSEVVTGDWPLVIIAWERDLGEMLEGFTPGNPMSFKFWDDEFAIEISDINVNMVQGNGNFADGAFARVELSGIRPPSHDIDLPVTELDFGDIEIGETLDLEFTISNTGGTPLTITSAIITGDVVFTMPLYENVVLNALEEDVITVTFAPLTEDDFNAQVLISSNDPDEPELTVDLMGGGYLNRHFIPVDPTAVVYPITVEFADIDDEALEAGDAIGVFDGNLCVGVHLIEDPVEWPVVIDTYGEVGEDPGFVDGNNIIYQFFDMGTDRVLLARGHYTLGDGTFGDGAGATVSLQARDAIIEFYNSVTIESQVFSNRYNRFFRDFGNIAALDEFATDGYDAELDAPEPGAPANNYISTYFPHPEWNAQFGDNFMVDVRYSEDDLTNAVKVYDVNVLTDIDAEMADLTFLIGDEFDDDLGVVLFDEDEEVYQNIREDDLYNYVTEFNIIRHFNLRLGDATAPVIDITYPLEDDTLEANLTHDLTWTIDDITSIRYVIVSYSLDDGNTWTRIDSLAGTDNGPVTVAWTIPDEFSTYCKMMVEAEDWAGNYSSVTTDYTFKVAPFAMYHEFASNWHLTSLPLIVDITDIVELFGDEIVGPYYVYDYNSDEGYFRTWDVVHGEGYWLALAEQADIPIQGIPEIDSSRIELDEVWNMVGTGVATEVPRDSLWFSDGNTALGFVDAVNQGWISPVMYGYDNFTGGYFFADETVPWNGYWLQTLVEDLDMISYPPYPGEAIALDNNNDNHANNELDDEFSWRVQIIAIQGTYRDSLGQIGADTSATDGYDVWLDVPTPPAPQGRYVRMTINHPEWNVAAGPYFSHDIRQNFEDQTTQSWDITVTASNPGEVFLNFEGIDEQIFELPDYSAWVIYGDGEAADTADLRHDPVVSFNHPGGEERFPVVVYISNFETDVDEGNFNEIPDEFQVSQAYPNPFNPSTMVNIELPQSANVMVRVFDLLGREIAMLDPGQLSAGYHSVTWNAKAASGIYFIQVSTDNNYTATRKVVLMK